MYNSKSGAADQFDQLLMLNQETYERDFLPAYEQLGIRPQRLVQIPLILPFHIPFRDGMCLTFELGEAAACTLAFRSLSAVHHVHAGVVTDNSLSLPQHRFRVEMIHASSSNSDIQGDENALTMIFDQMLGKLNSVIVAYMVLTKDHQVHRVSREMFEFGSVFRSVIPGEWIKGATGLLLLHWQVPFEKPEIATELYERVAWYTNVVEHGLNPFILVEELSLAARREFLGGGYREAVIFAQTAVETMLATLLSQAMKAEERSDEEIEFLLQEVGFVTRLRREYHTRFGGSWDVVKYGTPVAEWYANTYKLRNRIVHAGYAPVFVEASAALESASKMIGFVISLVRKAKKQYPSLQPFFEEPCRRPETEG